MQLAQPLTLPFFLNFAMASRKTPRRRASETEEMLKQVLPGSAKVVHDPEAEAEMKTSSGLSRMIDMRIPAWQLGAALAAGGFTLISMWFSVQSLTTSMQKVQATLEAGTAQTMQTALEIDRLKSRMERTEESYRSLQQQINQQQYPAPAQRPPR